MNIEYLWISIFWQLNIFEIFVTNRLDQAMVVTAVCIQFLTSGYGIGFSAPSLGQVFGSPDAAAGAGDDCDN